MQAVVSQLIGCQVSVFSKIGESNAVATAEETQGIVGRPQPPRCTQGPPHCANITDFPPSVIAEGASYDEALLAIQTHGSPIPFNLEIDSLLLNVTQ